MPGRGWIKGRPRAQSPVNETGERFQVTLTLGGADGHAKATRLLLASQEAFQRSARLLKGGTSLTLLKLDPSRAEVPGIQRQLIPTLAREAARQIGQDPDGVVGIDCIMLQAPWPNGYTVDPEAGIIALGRSGVIGTHPPAPAKAKALLIRMVEVHPGLWQWQAEYWY